jgi:DNA-binding NarL/FixJ family response regulator
MLGMVCVQAVPGAEVRLAKDGASGLSKARDFQPDLVILDVALPDGDGIDLLPDLFRASPRSKVIAVSSYVDEFTIHRALRSKAHGFLDKNEQPVKVLGEAIAAVMAGRRYLSSVVQRAQANLRGDPFAFSKVLTGREQEMLQIFGLGLSTKEIAERLSLSVNTVRVHRCSVMAKLDLHTTGALIRYAVEKGFTRARPGEAVGG